MLTSVRATFAACAAWAVVLSLVPEAHALDAFWHGVRSRFWHHGLKGSTSNWYSQAPAQGAPLNVPNGVANFAFGALRHDVIIAKSTSIGSMIFQDGVEKYGFVIRDSAKFKILGAGIRNNGSETPTFRLRDRLDTMRFENRARIEGPVSIKSDGRIFFDGRTNAGGAEIDNRRFLTFNNKSSAGKALVVNQGLVQFFNRSTAGKATIINGGGIGLGLTRGLRNDGRVTAGEVSNLGNGSMSIGTNQLVISENLTLGRKGELDIEIRDGAVGNIIVNKNASTRGKLTVHDHDGKRRRYTILKALGSRSGRFSEVVLKTSGSLAARIVYLANEVQLVLRRK